MVPVKAKPNTQGAAKHWQQAGSSAVEQAARKRSDKEPPFYMLGKWIGEIALLFSISLTIMSICSLIGAIYNV